ncbi:MAG: hypothetical protein NW217_07165 [Hyphomicrobiaceae bacterium]|nr:hypothetical protein [Hyphomicrobiaceae bacterium]
MRRMAGQGISGRVGRSVPGRPSVIVGLCAVAWLASAPAAWAQTSGTSGWDAGTSLDQQEQGDTPDAGVANTTVVPRSPMPDAGATGESSGLETAGPTTIRLVALLTSDGQRIDRGVVWRIYQETDEPGGQIKLVSTSRQAVAQVALEPGSYIVNAAFGRANLTRSISVEPGVSSTEQFVINAGGLRLTPMIGKSAAPPTAVSYDIYEGEQRQSSERVLVMSGARPGLIIRLNAGIYHIVSTYGDANAKVSADITVEAGKLSEVVLAHAAAKVTLRLVTRPGGDALPDTQWQIATQDGHVVKRSVGALPTHVLAPGTYSVTASHGGRNFDKPIEVKDGEMAKVELLMR